MWLESLVGSPTKAPVLKNVYLFIVVVEEVRIWVLNVSSFFNTGAFGTSIKECLLIHSCSRRGQNLGFKFKNGISGATHLKFTM